ncbi:MAG: hypothetical protein WCZ65_06955 [Lysobacteraceae bacterium]
MRVISRVILAAIVLLLAACAAAPVSQPFNRQAAAVSDITVLPMRHSEIDLTIVNNPGNHFGLIGLAIVESNRVPKRNWLRDALTQRDYDHVEAFRVALTRALEDRDYTLHWVPPVMESKSSQVKRHINGQRKRPGQVETDAQLDVNFGFVGYAAAGTGDNAPYRPTVVLNARLLSADGKTVLFEETILHNQVFGVPGTPVVIEPDPAYFYPDFDALEASPDQVAEGMRGAVEAVAVELARQL